MQIKNSITYSLITFIQVIHTENVLQTVWKKDFLPSKKKIYTGPKMNVAQQLKFAHEKAANIDFKIFYLKRAELSRLNDL